MESGEPRAENYHFINIVFVCAIAIASTNANNIVALVTTMLPFVCHSENGTGQAKKNTHNIVIVYEFPLDSERATMTMVVEFETMLPGFIENNIFNSMQDYGG